LAQAQGFWEFELFVVGETPKAKLAYDNLRSLCDEYLLGRCKITIHDIAKNPKLAKANEITAIPTIIRKTPLPRKTLIGDLSNSERAITRLELKIV
jgi:circadian clock protein KaiB